MSIHPSPILHDEDVIKCCHSAPMLSLSSVARRSEAEAWCYVRFCLGWFALLLPGLPAGFGPRGFTPRASGRLLAAPSSPPSDLTLIALGCHSTHSLPLTI